MGTVTGLLASLETVRWQLVLLVGGWTAWLACGVMLAIWYRRAAEAGRFPRRTMPRTSTPARAGRGKRQSPARPDAFGELQALLDAPPEPPYGQPRGDDPHR